MFEQQILKNQNIIDCLHSNYNLEIATLLMLPLGADMQASIYKAQAENGKSYFIKIKREYKPNVAEALAHLLYDAGVEQIIMPIQTNSGKDMHTMGNYSVIVYPFIEGKNGFTRDLTSDQWVILGKALRLMHEMPVPPSIQSQIRQETYAPIWREAVLFLLQSMETKSVYDEISLQFIKCIATHKEVIHRLVDRAEYLSQQLKDLSVEYVLCHADIHAGNILIDEKDSIYIVDWDDPMMAPKERDLMFIGGGVANVWNKPHEEALFYKGYGTTEVNRTLLAYYRHERIVEDIAEFCQALLDCSVSLTDKQKMYKHFIDMFEPQGVIDIAFKTDIVN